MAEKIKESAKHPRDIEAEARAKNKSDPALPLPEARSYGNYAPPPPEPEHTVEQARRLWQGGEKRKAAEILRELSDKDQAILLEEFRPEILEVLGNLPPMPAKIEKKKG